jgi:hypothetical protein
MAERVRVIYHHEDGSWWAISPELPDIIAAGDSREEVQRLVEEGLAEEDYEVVHLGPEEPPNTRLRQADASWPTLAALSVRSSSSRAGASRMSSYLGSRVASFRLLAIQR